MSYPFNDIEAKWQKYWAEHNVFNADNHSEKPKYYVLDMFPYPSGAGLHVGHPLGYIASDIYARYQRHRGYNVLHPMGYDSFGLPAEQYAIQTGQHPAITTEANITRYREQLNTMGFSFDWYRQVRTSDPDYYRWTQWIFIQLFNSWYDTRLDKAQAIDTLVARLETEGNASINSHCDADTPRFTAAQWNGFSEEIQQQILLKYRLAYLAETEVNWCPVLGTVLANDEIINGVSERGGHPVIRKKMTQWSMRISAYAERLLQGLDTIDWPEPLKEMQRHWIGKSVGAVVRFNVVDSDKKIEVFTTRPDTVFGVSFMVLAPEHDLVKDIITQEQQQQVTAYIEATAKRSERDRMADVKTVSGVFTGAYALHPFTGKAIPVWIGDYVLAGYGTGAVMAVPCGDQRDHDFATYFKLPILHIFEGIDTSKVAFVDKRQTVIAHSDFLNGLTHKEATRMVIARLEAAGKGNARVNYRMRDAVFSRQRYWGEPFPIYYKNKVPYPIPEKCLPLHLPEVEKYLPTETGDPPLGNATHWAWDIKAQQVVANTRIDHTTVFPLELNTMPGWAGSSWYFNRYMDARNTTKLFAPEAVQYWRDVDLYIGGSEHATGHLLYARFWQHFLYDKNLVPVKEFARKLINQGMILGESAFVYRLSPMIADKGNAGVPVLSPVNFDRTLLSKGCFEYHDEPSENKHFIDDFMARFMAQLPAMHTLFLTRVFGADSTHFKLMDGMERHEIESYLRERIRFTIDPIPVDVSLVDSSNELDIKGFKIWRPEYKNAIFIGENGEMISEKERALSGKKGTSFIVIREVEKMSKSKYNVIPPDAICKKYGADTLRMYEMFLGPLEQAKPWNTAGITGVHSFLKKLWRLYVDNDNSRVTTASPSKENLKTLHKTIKKVQEDIENFSFNTSVATFMICVNELMSQRCTSRAILEPLVILISPYAPHIAEELWQRLGHSGSIAYVSFPEFDAQHLVEGSKEYPISFNGKKRFTIILPPDLSKEAIETAVMAHEKTQQQLQGQRPKKIIVVPGKIINIVV